jgi:hypothetical protein
MLRPQFTLKTLLWVVVVVAAFCTGTQLDRYRKERDPSQTRIRAALDEKTELDFTDQPLSDVIEYLKAKHEIEIQLDQKALADAGVSSDTTVTRNIKGITLRSALRLLLGELDLTYVIQNGALMITTKREVPGDLYSLKTLLWIMVGVAALLGAILCDRAWRRRAYTRLD